LDLYLDCSGDTPKQDFELVSPTVLPGDNVFDVMRKLGVILL
jgi:hypothetical protein